MTALVSMPVPFLFCGMPATERGWTTRKNTPSTPLYNAGVRARSNPAGSQGSRMMSTRRLYTVGSLDPVWPIGSCRIIVRAIPSASS